MAAYFITVDGARDLLDEFTQNRCGKCLVRVHGQCKGARPADHVVLVVFQQSAVGMGVLRIERQRHVAQDCEAVDRDALCQCLITLRRRNLPKRVHRDEPYISRAA